MSLPLIRVATIGTWGHFSHVLREIAPMPQVRFVAHARSLSDDSPDQIHKITGQNTVPWFDDYQQMLRAVRPDVAIISTRLDRIAPIAIDAAEAGCHLICEKPLALDLSHLDRLRAACIARKRHCICMLGNSRNPAMLAAAQLIRDGRIGDVVLVNARKSYKWGTRPEWFGRREIYGDTIGWVAIHALDMIHSLAAQDFTSVAAMQSNRVHRDRPDCQDNGVILFTLSGGGHASVSFDYLRPEGANTHGDTWIRVVGSRGIIEASLDDNWCRLTADGATNTPVPLPAEGPYYAKFIEELSQNLPYPPPETQRNFMLAHVSLCASESANRKSVIVIPENQQPR
jgi:predicted dehydrogenase